MDGQPNAWLPSSQSHAVDVNSLKKSVVFTFLQMIFATACCWHSLAEKEAMALGIGQLGRTEDCYWAGYFLSELQQDIGQAMGLAEDSRSSTDSVDTQ